MTNNFSSLLPVLIDPILLPIFYTKRNTGKKEERKKLKPLDHSPRPYRVVVSNDNIMITEWMLHPDGTVNRTPWGIVKKDYIEKNNIRAFYIFGRNGRYFLLKDGHFKIPVKPNAGLVHVFINDVKMEFKNIYPFSKYVVQAKSIKGGISLNQFVGIGWRKVIPVNGRDIDVTLTLLVDAMERGIGWKVIASEPQNEKYLYSTSLNYLSEQGELHIKIESEEK